MRAGRAWPRATITGSVGERRTEKAVQKGARRVLKRRGAWVLSTHFAAKSRRGVPDLIACHRGVFLALECKSPANDHPLSPTQRLELLAVERAGGLTCVVKDEADVERALDSAEKIADGRLVASSGWAFGVNPYADDTKPYEVVLGRSGSVRAQRPAHGRRARAAR